MTPDHPRTVRPRSVRLLLAVLGAVLLAGVVPAVGLGPAAPTPAAAATVRTYGGGPIDEVNAAARAFARHDCGLSAERLAAMMLAPTFQETGAPTSAAPGPMTLSRWDTQAALYAFGNKATPYQKAFWHPGVGMWQFDSAGFWPLTAATAIDARTSARQAAQVMATRYCASTAATVGDKMRYAWGPWYYCTAAGDNVCILRFREHFSESGLVNLRRDDSVTRFGGMTHNTCRIAGIGEVACARVDPSKAQGYAAWAIPSFGPTPVSSTFYVVEHQNREYRYWLRQDTGYPETVVAHKPVTANARTALTWQAFTTTGPTLCDTTLGRGECGGTFGALEEVTPLVGAVRVSGWAIDPDTSAPIDVRVVVDGTVRATVRADRNRPDVGAAHPGSGPNHGFLATVDVDAGARRVCVQAVDTVAPIVANTQLGCRTVTVTSGSPFGNFEGLQAIPGGVRVQGWAIDPNTPDPIHVHVYVNGVGRANVRADVPRADVGAAHPAAGPDHGFDIPITGLPAGSQNVCAYAINVGAGGNVELGCKRVQSMGGSPIGFLESVRPGPGRIDVSGWTLDPDTRASIPVHLYLDGVGRAITADGVRNDVGAAFPAYGPAHGFSTSFESVAPGRRQLCAYGIEVAGTGSHTLLGCRTVTVPGGSPTGRLEVATAGPGTIRVAGWAIDPDTPASIPVHLYVDGVGRANLRADGERPDLAPHFPGYGTRHGFATTLTGVGAGPRQVCAFGIDVAGGHGHTLLGCTQVVVPGGSPVGAFDAVTSSDGTLTASGWAIDPDTAAPIPVHVYFGSAGGVATTADRPRQDLVPHFPAYGPNHGWTARRAVPPGTHQVCAYAINVGVGGTTLLGCRTITT